LPVIFKLKTIYERNLHSYRIVSYRAPIYARKNGLG